MTKAVIGTISHGTLRTPDLLTAFADELARLSESERTHGALIRDARAYARIWEANHLNGLGSEAAIELVQELSEALEEFAPSYTYFGSNPWDGSDFGFWPSDTLAQDVRDNDGLVISDLYEVPEGYSGEALVINDHGNATLYAFDKGIGLTVWEIV